MDRAFPRRGAGVASSRTACLGRPHCRCRPAEWLAMTCPPKPGPFLPHLLLHRPPNNGLVSISRQNGGIYGLCGRGADGARTSCAGPKESLTLGPLPNPDARGRCAPSTHTVVRKARATLSQPRTGPTALPERDQGRVWQGVGASWSTAGTLPQAPPRALTLFYFATDLPSLWPPKVLDPAGEERRRRNGYL